MPTLAEQLEISAGAYCPRCTERLKKHDTEGGRCTQCGTMLTSVHLADCPRWTVRSKHGDMTVRAENQAVLERAIRGYGSILSGASVTPATT